MKVLLVSSDDPRDASVLAVAQQAGHTVHHLRDERAALSQLKVLGPNVIFSPEVSFIEHAKRVAGNQFYGVLLTGPLTDEHRLAAREAGVDDEIVMPGSSARVQCALASARRACGEVQAAQGAPSANPIELISQSFTWKSMPREFAATAGKFLTLPASARNTIPNTPLEVASTIVMASAQQQVELRLDIGADAASARALSVHLFGEEEGPTLTADMNNELANLFMGAAKAAFSAESIAFAAGVPTALPPQELGRGGMQYQRQETFALHLADAVVVVYVGARNKGNVSLKPGELREGMVIAKDVHNARGLLLIPGGTRLSMTMTERLRGQLPPAFIIEVMTPDVAGARGQ